MRTLLFSLAGIALLFATALCITGCAPPKAAAPVVKPPSLVAHPFVAATVTVQKAQTSLRVLGLLAFAAFAVGVGLYFTPLSWLSTIAVPVAGSVAALSYIGAIAVPFFPIVIYSAGGLVLLLIVYELIHAKGNVKTAFTDLEEDVGLKTAPEVPALKVSSTVVPTPVQLVHT